MRRLELEVVLVVSLAVADQAGVRAVVERRLLDRLHQGCWRSREVIYAHIVSAVHGGDPVVVKIALNSTSRI